MLAALALGALWAGCGGKAAHPFSAMPRGPTPPKLATANLFRLLPLAQLRWFIWAKPREIAAIPWLIPSIATVAPEENLDRFAAISGLDLRQIPEVIVAFYVTEASPSTVYLLRHRADPHTIERKFRKRLTGEEHRIVERDDVVRVSGKIGSTPCALVVLGGDVVAFQVGGRLGRGPARIAALYATDKLKKSPTLLDEEPLRSLHARFGEAPLRALSLGPFEGELARGARGLLAGATAIGAAVRPSARERIALTVAVTGDFSQSGEAASRELTKAYRELAGGSFGRLLGLETPLEPPLSTYSPDTVAMAVELDPERLARGIRALTSAQIEEIMR